MKKKILRISGILILLMGLYSLKSYAVISATSKTVESGSKVSILVTSDVPVLSYKVTMTDAGGLTFSGSSGGTGAGTTTITDAKATGMKNLATFTFNAPTVTTDTKFSVKFSASAMEDENFNAVANDTAVAVITVKAKTNEENTGNTDNSGGSTSNSGSSTSNSGGTTNNDNNGSTSSKSTNANLKNLGIRPNDFTGFNANTTSYSVTVPYSVEQIEVYAQVKDSKAKITSGTGTKKLKEGSNNFEVVVTAEAGNTKTYKLTVIRNSEEEIVPNVIEEPSEDEKPETLFLTAIVLQNDLNLTLTPEFNSEIFEYTVEVENDVDSLELSGIPNLNGANVIIAGNENLVEGENIITITVKSEGYQDVVYTIKVNKKAIEIIEEVEEISENLEENKNKIIEYIVAGSIVAIIIILIVIILVKKKQDNKRLSSSFYDYYRDYSNDTKISDDENIEDNKDETEGYTVEIENDDEYIEKPKRRKGKHF